MNDQPKLHIEEIGQIAIMVDDLDRAVRFYRDVLGLPLMMQVPGMAFLHCGPVRLLLGLAEKPESRPKTSILYFRVADIEAAEAKLREHGTTIVAPAHFVAKLPDHELWIGFFNDSEGNMMALMAQKPLGTM